MKEFIAICIFNLINRYTYFWGGRSLGSNVGRSGCLWKNIHLSIPVKVGIMEGMEAPPVLNGSEFLMGKVNSGSAP